MRARKNGSAKESRQLTLSGFRGVDLSSIPSDVAAYHASKMRNFISQNGANHKRPGWREYVNFGGRVVNGVKVYPPINGIFEFISGDTRKMIVQVEDRLVEVTSEGSFHNLMESCTYGPAKLGGIDAEGKSQGFMLNGALYIIGCGDFLVYKYYESSGKYELRRVFDNEDVYIPTTSIGMTGRYWDVENSKWIESSGAATLDDVNLLSSSRKNMFIGHATDSLTEEVQSIRYQLDGTIKPGTIVEVVAENGNSSAGGTVYSDGSLIANEWNYSSLSGTAGSATKPMAKDKGVHTLRNSAEDFHNLYEILPNGLKGDRVGYITEDGELYLYSLYEPPIEMESNITVTFTAFDEDAEERHKMITKCTFGTRFGTERSSDRLFLSGNPDYPNIDFHSEENDFTYFGELSVASLGDESSAVAGYAKLSDSSLVIYKEESNSEPSFFFRTAKYLEDYDADGNVVSMRGIFPHTEGGVGEGVISRHTQANLCGDCLFLTRSGVYGLVLSENMMTTERYARERSKNIRSALEAHEDLSRAVATVYKNKYYLAIDGVCYVADPRYKFTASDDIDGSFNYEWWVWDNIPARVWGKVGDDLYFGTDDGRVCVFDDEYTDRSYFYTFKGDVTVDITDGSIAFNTTSEELSNLREGDNILFYNGLYALVGEIIGMTEDGRALVDMDTISDIFDNEAVFIDTNDDGDIGDDEYYYAVDLDRADGSFLLYNSEWKKIDPPPTGSKLYKRVSGKTLYLFDDADKENGRFFLKQHSEGKVLRLAQYKEPTVPLMGRVTYNRNVVAEWVTPVLDLGTNVYSKTLTGMTVAAKSSKGGKLSFGYETKNAERSMVAGGSNIFSLEDFSFNDFTFDGEFQNSYTVRLFERAFNYICFRFKSDSAADCVINDFTVNYKINKKNKGVR